jgi:dihydroorotase
MDWILEARCLVEGQLTDCRLGIDEETGTIAAVKRTLTGAPVRRFPGAIVLPSAVDMHVHLRDPGATKKEDFRTGTMAALLGGVGTVFDMPNTHPVVDTVRNLEEKAEEVASKALVDYGLWATVTGRTDEPNRLAAAADGIKLYMAPTTGVAAATDPETIDMTLAAARGAGRLVAVHAEAPIAPDAATLAQHEAGRPLDREAETVGSLARRATSRDAVHVCHASGVPVAEAAEAAGFSLGVTPHHLLLHLDKRWALAGKVNPPLRPAAVQTALWEAFAAGAPWVVETDHAPHLWAEKDQPFTDTPAGLPGVQTTYPILLAMAKRGRVPLAQVVAACATRPAERLGIDKGRIAVGAAADVVVVRPKEATRIRRDWLASKAGWSPYEGEEAVIPVAHVLAGQFVVEDGQADAKAGRGRRIRPGPPGSPPTRSDVDATPRPPR